LERDLETLHRCDTGSSVILFPGILGGLNGYSNLLAELSRGYSVYGLKYPLHRLQKEGNAVQALGAACALCVREAAVKGQIHLVGWSMGGLVAYECAAALYGAGFPLGGVIMIDAAPGMASAPPPQYGEGDIGLQNYIWCQFAELKCGREAMLRLLERGFLQMSEGDRLSAVAEHEKKWSRNLIPPLELRTCFGFMKANYLAMRTYVPSTYPGRFHAIGSAEYAEIVASGWRGTAGDVVTVKGDHLTAILHFAVAPIMEMLASASMAAS
jgi:thioesterase domain-containing protein